MSEQPIYWIAVDGPLTQEEAETLKDNLEGELGELDFIISTKEIEPIDEQERKQIIKKLTQALGSDE